jgi:bifunctional non-homologous end joining protein LigD
MGDQLSLAFEPRLPAAPGTLRPMLARPAPAPFDSPSHLFEPTWGGRRVLAFLEPAVDEGPDGRFTTVEGAPSVRLVDEAGDDLSATLPEMAGLAMRLDARSAVLDGELVVVDRSGRADERGLERRLSGSAGPDVAFLCFDVLYLDGRPLLNQPLERRRERLGRLLRPGPDIVVVPSIAEEGRALFDAAAAQGLAGVMARVRTSPYLPGVRSRLWRFVAAGEAGVAAGNASDAVAEADDTPKEIAPNAPVLALIQRLPLDDES